MKPTNNPIDKELYRLMQESRRKASPAFTDGIMQQLAAKPEAAQRLPRRIFRPLLSWRALLTFLGTAGAISWLCSLLMAPDTNNSSIFSSWLPAYRLPDLEHYLSPAGSWLLLAVLLALFLLAGLDRLLKQTLSRD